MPTPRSFSRNLVPAALLAGAASCLAIAPGANAQQAPAPRPAAISPAPAAPQQPPQEAPRYSVTQRVGGYEVTLEWATPELQLGQPAYVRCSYRMVKAEEQQRFGVRWDLAGDLIVLIHYPDPRTVRVEGANPVSLPLTLQYEPERGELQSLEMPILYVGETFTGLAFQRPGEYRVSVQLVLTPSGSKVPVALTLPKIPIRVKAPAPNSPDQASVNWINKLIDEDVDIARSVFRDLQTMTATPDNVGRFKELLKVCEGGAMEPYVRFALVNRLTAEGQWVEAALGALHIADKFPTCPIADDAIGLSVYIYDQMNDPEGAQRAFRRLAYSYPRSNRLKTGDANYKKHLIPAVRPLLGELWPLYPAGDGPTQEERDFEVAQAALTQKRVAEINSVYVPPKPSFKLWGQRDYEPQELDADLGIIRKQPGEGRP